MEKFCDFLTLRPSDLITILTYVLMDKFCPCFYLHCFNLELKESLSLENKELQ